MRCKQTNIQRLGKLAFAGTLSRASNVIVHFFRKQVLDTYVVVKLGSFRSGKKSCVKKQSVTSNLATALFMFVVFDLWITGYSDV